MVPPLPLYLPFPHSYSVGAKTPSPPHPPSSAAVRRPIHRRPPPPCQSWYPDAAVHYKRSTSLIPGFGPGSLHPVLSLHPRCRPPCRRLSYDRLIHRALPPPSTLLDLLPRCRQPSLPQHRQILSRCIHGAAPEAVLFRICSSYLLQQENRSPLLYSDFLSWLRSCLCPVCTVRSAIARSTLYSQCLWFSPLYSTLVKSQ